MNKLTKGIIAGAAGILLLSGGAGTFAAWNSTATIADQTVTTGHLAVTLGATGSWYDHTVVGSTTTNTEIPTIGDFNLVPGDTIEYDTTITVQTKGDHLEGKLGFTNPSLTGVTAASNYTINVTADTSAYADNFAYNSTTKTYTVTPKADDTDFTNIPVKVSIALNSTAGDTTATDEQNKSITLSGSAITLNQILPTAQ